MVYDWRPSGHRSVTSDLGVAVRPDQVTGAPREPARPQPSASRPDDATVAAVVDTFLASATAGRTLNRSGRPYMPSALRDLRGILESHVVPRLGAMPLGEVRRHDVQALVDRLGADGLSESRIRSVVSAVRALYGYAIERDLAPSNPAEALVMPRGDDRGSGRPEPPPPAPAPASASVRADLPPAREEPARRPSAAFAGEDGIAGLRSRLEDLWEQRPAWEYGGADQDERAPQERAAGGERRAKERKRAEHEPIAMLPERMLSIALRAVLVLLAIVAVVSFLESF
jgi:hypothetical protein